MATKTKEQGIRDYLTALSAKPAKAAPDKEGIKAVKDKIKAAKGGDPIALLELYAELEVVSQPVEPEPVNASAFIANAKEYADEKGIPVAGFVALGVPEDVLKAAGFSVGEAKAAKASTAGGRKPRIPYETYKAAAVKLGSGWKVADLAEAIDRDAGTATNYVKKLVEEGVIKVVGDDPNHDGRGRAPKVYAKA